MRVLCKVSYDGSEYLGYQKQNNGNTIQNVIEDCLKRICKKEVIIHSSGRTDAKVHENGQMFHFDTDLKMSELNWYKALNSLLPKDIRIKKVFFVEDDFHSRFNATSKNYIYKINMGEYNLFERNYVTQYNKKINIERIKEISELFVGTHDFKNFCANNEKDIDYIRVIYSIDIIEQDNYLYISFVGSGFKRYMIRMIVGTMLEYAKGKIDTDYILDRLDTTIFNTTGYNAAPEGLYLNKVYYGRSEIDED